jgi:diguanylate cyclase (GGDEF)-like protein
MVQSLISSASISVKRRTVGLWRALERRGLLTPDTKPASLSEMEPQIDEWLTARFSYLNLPADVRAAFRSKTQRGRRAWIANWSMCIALLNLLHSLFDPGMLQGGALQRDLALRILVSGGFASAAVLMRRGHGRASDELLVCLPPLFALVCAGLSGLSSHSMDVFHHFLTMAVVVIYTAVLLLPVELFGTMFLAISTVVILTGFLLVKYPHCFPEEAQSVCFCGSVMAALVYARHAHNANEYRLFLMKKKKDIILFQQTRHNAQLSSIAYTDPLTDVPNRRYFTELIEAIEVNPKLYLPLAICMMDIDAFKNLNDQCGHGEGDRCLRQVADTLRSHLRHNSDVVARYGGEEFVLILPHTTAGRANDVAERMRLAVLALDYPNPGTALGCVTMSTGIAVATEAGQVRNLVEAADLALYQAKAAGRNRTVVLEEI